MSLADAPNGTSSWQQLDSNNVSYEISYNRQAAVNVSSYHAVQQVLDRYITTVVCILGCFGNIVNLVVLVRMRRRHLDGGRENAANIGLISLAMSDLIFCIVMLPRGFSSTRGALFKHGFFLYYQAYGSFLVTTFILTGTWITVTMATLRYLAICHPLFSRRFDSANFAKLSYITVFILGVLFNLPYVWEYTVSPFEGDMYMLDIGLINLSEPIGQAYQCIRAILGIFIPALILLFCNVSLIAALRRSNRMRRECHVKDAGVTARNRVTAILIIIATSFIVLVFPSELMDFFHNVSVRSANTELYTLVRHITNLLQVINFSCNFVLYCSLNVHFRNVLRETLCNWTAYRNHSGSGDAASDFERQWLQFTRTGNGSLKTTFTNTRL